MSPDNQQANEEVFPPPDIDYMAKLGYELDRDYGWQQLHAPVDCPPCPYRRLDMSLCFFSHRCMAPASEFPSV